MLNLIVSNPTVQSGTVPLSWCVDKATLQALAQRDAKDLMLLLVICRKGTELNSTMRESHEIRVVPLRDLMTFISFNKPGEYRIFARIVWSHTHGDDDPRDAMLRTSPYCLFNGRTYRDDWAEQTKDPVRWDEAWFERHHGQNAKDLALAAELDLVVPAECFAPEPPEWEQRWVNWIFSRKPADECGYRKLKWFFAIPFQWIFFALIYLFRAVATLGSIALLAWRGLDFRPLYQPLAVDTDFIWRNADEPLLLLSDEKEPHRFFRWTFIPLAPLWVGILAGVIATSPKIGFASGLLAALAILGCVSLGIAIVGLIRTVNWLLAKPPERAGLAAEAAESAPPPTPWYLRDEELHLIECSTAPRPLKVADLPKNRRTIHLRFTELKADVCRPFAR